MDPGIDRSATARAAAEALLRDPALSLNEIARRVGVSRHQVQEWNRQSSLRLPLARGKSLAAWPPERRAAALRLLAVEGHDPGDLTEALGFARHSAPTLLSALGVGRSPARRAKGTRAPGGSAMQPHRLRALLRAHIGRQIEAFDAALAEPRPGIDSAKVLRDLGGLKRLLDDLGTGDGSSECDERGEGEPRDAATRPGPDSTLDLDRLRAEIARRYERFVGGGAAG